MAHGFRGLQLITVAAIVGVVVDASCVMRNQVQKVKDLGTR